MQERRINKQIFSYIFFKWKNKSKLNKPLPIGGIKKTGGRDWNENQTSVKASCRELLKVVLRTQIPMGNVMGSQSHGDCALSGGNHAGAAWS